jgi:hypothetical protein
MRIRVERLLLAAGLVISANTVGAAPIPLTVGQGLGFNFSTLSAAVNSEMSGNSYLITMAPGTYQNDFSVVSQPTDIEATGPGVVLQATMTNDQGIIETFAPLTVNGLTITGAMASAGSGGPAAAIRDHNDGGGNLIVSNSLIENSQNGIETSSASGQTHLEHVTISNDNFVGDGSSLGPGHAVYIGDAATADIINSTFCGTVSGHDIKSRALSTTVTGSTMYIAATGTAGAGCSTVGSTSAGVDLPNGGVGVIQNDMIIQGTNNSNGALVIYGGESPFNSPPSLDVSGTTFFGDGAANSVGVNEIGGCLAPVTGTSNNSFTNVTTPVNPPGCVAAAPPVVPSVPEPPSLWLLLTALSGCCAAAVVARARQKFAELK